MPATFMLWVDLVPEAGPETRIERDKLTQKLADADKLELRASALRAAVQEGRIMLRERVLTQWVVRDIERVAVEAERQGLPLPPGHVDDTELRAALLALDRASDSIQMLQALEALDEMRSQSVFRRDEESRNGFI